jgi:hypothetical protein
MSRDLKDKTPGELERLVTELWQENISTGRTKAVYKYIFLTYSLNKYL